MLSPCTEHGSEDSSSGGFRSHVQCSFVCSHIGILSYHCIMHFDLGAYGFEEAVCDFGGSHARLPSIHRADSEQGQSYEAFCHLW